MGQVLRLVPGSLIILLAITAEPGRAAEQQFSCNGDIIHDQTNPNPLDKPKPIDLNVTLGDENKLSIKTGDGKLLSPRITSDNKLQLRFETDELSENIFIIRANYFSSTPLGNSRGSLARALENPAVTNTAGSDGRLICAL